MKIAIDSRVFAEINAGIPNYSEYLMSSLPRMAKDIDWIYYINKNEDQLLNMPEYLIKQDIIKGKEKLLEGKLYTCTQQQLAKKKEDIFSGKATPWNN